MKKLLSIIFCIGIILCLASCQNPNGNTENIKTTYVEDLNIAIKKNPTEYNGKQVTVKGYSLSYYNGLYLTDYYTCNEADRNNAYICKRANIKIVITDDVLLTVLGNSDYIEVTGTVTISNGEIYLDNCTYTMITAYEERQ